jgi:plasmid stabilization system protein ParE
LIWSPAATDDLESIREFIARDSVQSARAFAAEVVNLAESIPTNPRLGAMVPEYARDDLRERLVHRDRVIYRLRGGDVEIVTLCHGARKLPPIP